MTVTAEKSTELTNIDLGKRQYASQWGGQLEVFTATFVQSGVGATGSTVELIRLPPGNFDVHLDLSRIEWDLQASGTTFDLGWAAYLNLDGTTAAASSAGLDSAVAADATGYHVPGAAITTGNKVYNFNSRGGVSIVATFTAIADATKVKLKLVVAKP